MTLKSLQILSDFNCGVLARFIEVQGRSRRLAVRLGEFGQVLQNLLTNSRDADRIDLVWTRPEGVIARFGDALEGKNVSHESVMEEVDAFVDALVPAAQRCQHCLVVAWALPPGQRGYGLLDWQPGVGLAHLLARMNLRLAEGVARAGNAHLLDGGEWFRGAPRAGAPKLWYTTKTPYSNAVFEAAAADVVRAVDAVSGASRRLIVLDLDDTIWGGVVGETGWEGLRLGGHDHVGEAYQDFQRHLKSLGRRGVQLAIVSKNDDAVALEAIDKHPEMVLRRDDFAGWRINWSDKAMNVAAVVDELGLGLGSVVFIDDNPAERARVREALPDVLVPDWPKDPTAYVSALHGLGCFDVAKLTVEDRNRTAMYAAERHRRASRSQVPSMEEWLDALELEVKVGPILPANHARVAQLFNKTNQVNLATRRLSENEILQWAEDGGRSLLTVSVSDRFGDMGLVGLVGVEANGARGKMIDFVMSCRVMGREVEKVMVYLAAEELRLLGARDMTAVYLPTKRNRPTLDLLRETVLREDPQFHFSLTLDQEMSAPKRPKIERVR